MQARLFIMQLLQAKVDYKLTNTNYYYRGKVYYGVLAQEDDSKDADILICWIIAF